MFYRQQWIKSNWQTLKLQNPTITSMANGEKGEEVVHRWIGERRHQHPHLNMYTSTNRLKIKYGEDSYTQQALTLPPYQSLNINTTHIDKWIKMMKHISRDNEETFIPLMLYNTKAWILNVCFKNLWNTLFIDISLLFSWKGQTWHLP